MSLPRNRPFRENLFLASSFSSIAGALNAGGFFAFGFYTSHVTGHWSRMCDELGTGQWLPALRFLSLALCYFLGSLVSSFLIQSRLEQSRRVRLFRPLALELFLLATFCVGGVLLDSKEHTLAYGLACLMCFTMGLQNAMTTLMSNVALRTTHMSGMTTDLGIDLVRLWLLARDRRDFARLEASELPFLAGPRPSLLRELGLILVSSESEKLRLELAILGCFAFGGVGGAYGFFRFGYLGALPIAVLLLILVWNELRAIREEGGLLAPALLPTRRTRLKTRVVEVLGTMPIAHEVSPGSSEGPPAPPPPEPDLGASGTAPPAKDASPVAPTIGVAVGAPPAPGEGGVLSRATEGPHA